MITRVNLTGKTFGRLTVVEEILTRCNGKVQWRCSCSCGNLIIVKSTKLLTGKTTSCGCGGNKNPKHHGLVNTPEYRAWSNMLQRCYNENNPEFKRYGARGICVCKPWRESFMNFYNHVGPRPSDSHSLDREDNDGHYEPGNCRWATLLEQANNKRTNVKHVYDGEELSITEISRRTGVNDQLIRQRLGRGKTLEESLTKESKLVFTHDGQTKHLEEWCHDAGLKYNTVWLRLFKYNWPFYKAISTPSQKGSTA